MIQIKTKMSTRCVDGFKRRECAGKKLSDLFYFLIPPTYTYTYTVLLYTRSWIPLSLQSLPIAKKPFLVVSDT